MPEYDTSQYVALKQKVQGSMPVRQEYTDEDVEQTIYQVLAQEAHEDFTNVRDRVSIGRRIFHAMRRLDVLQPYLEDPEITEIMVNGPEHIFIERDGRLYRTDTVFESETRLEDVIQQIVGTVNRTVNESNPIVDARLADGSRVNAVLPPVALNGPILTIRKFREEPITMEELVAWGTITQEAADFLKDCVRKRYNVFICGGTASGKTTFLNILSDCIPKDERIITIEDAAELRLSSLENLVTLETRKAGVEGKGEITIRDLIRTSLRMRPNRIIVGEIRGAEAIDMLQAMNTGHEGSLSTGHANSCADMVSRIESMVLQGASFPIEAIRAQIASAIDLMVYLTHRPDGRRQLTEIVQLKGMAEGQVVMEPIFIRKEDRLIRTDNAFIEK